MKIVVIGGTGLIGSKLVALPPPAGPRSACRPRRIPASTRSPAKACRSAGRRAVVVDVANSPSFEDAAVLKFFETSGRNLLAAEAAAGVRHHVALSVVGTGPAAGQRLPPREAGAGDADQGFRRFRTRSCAPRSSSSSWAASPTRPATARRCASPPASCSRSSRTTSSRRWPTSRSARPRTASSRSPARRSFGSTSSSGRVLTQNNDAREVTADAHARYFGAELDDRVAGARRQPAPRRDAFRHVAQPRDVEVSRV